MVSYRKYMFDLDFDRPQPRAVPEARVEEPEEAEDIAEPEPEPEPPPPMFSEEELALAREAAYQEGRQAGEAQANQRTERLAANVMIALSDQMATLFRQQEEANEANSRAAVRVAMSVLKKVLPAACEANAFNEVTRVVEEVVAHILDEPRIIVKVGEQLVDAVRERLDAVCQAHGFEGRVVVQADVRMIPGDCRVEWTDGGAERDQVRLIEEIEATVERALGAETTADDADEFAGT